jgi:hypothetical protein
LIKFIFKKRILDGETVSDPILQILQMKNIQNNQDGVVRYKVTLFDGEGQHTCKTFLYFSLSFFKSKNFLFSVGILATQKNHLVEDKSLKLGSVIRLEEFAANVLSKDPPK